MKYHSSQKYRNACLAIIASNAIDSYDLMVCMFLSTFISQALFPTNDPKLQLINFLFVNFLACLAKPFGGIFFGMIADLFGRKYALLLSIAVVTTTTTAIALIPSYHSIGFYSVMCLVILRFVQNMATLGEYTNSLVYLIESASTNNRYFHASLVGVGSSFGCFSAGVMCWLLFQYFTDAELLEYAWRLPMLFALPLGLVGLVLRRYSDETRPFLNHSTYQKPSFHSTITASFHFVLSNLFSALSIFVWVWFGVALTLLIFVLGPQFFQAYQHEARSTQLLAQTISYGLLIPFLLGFGKIATRTSPIQLMLYSSVGLTFMLIPHYMLLQSHNVMHILLGQILMVLPAACYFALCPTLAMHIAPSHIRGTAGAFIYTVPSSIASGLTPYLVACLNQWFNIDYAYLIVLMVLGFLSSCILIIHVLRKTALTRATAEAI